MARRVRVAVLYGGCNEEHDISRASAAAVLEHLDRDRFDAVGIYVTKAGHWLPTTSRWTAPGTAR